MDIVAEEGLLLLGSRLKRLAERLQADAAELHRKAGIALQPTQMTLLMAVERCQPATVGELADAIKSSQPGITRLVGQVEQLGLVDVSHEGDDRRKRQISLTAEGRAVLDRAKCAVWPGLGAALTAIDETLEGSLLDRIAGLETALQDESLASRVTAGPRPTAFTTHDFSPELAPHFRRINEEWIHAMFTMEEEDRRLLDDPQGEIIDKGGHILFVEAGGMGVVGTCALIDHGPNGLELAKMGVLNAARGLGAGRAVLEAAIARAREIGAEPLFLQSNKDCTAAIALYEEYGFEHDAQQLERARGRYARCDVAMVYRGQ